MHLSGSFLPSEGLIASHLEHFKLILPGIRVANVFPGSVEEPAVSTMFSGYTGSWPHVLVCKAFSYPLPLARAAQGFFLASVLEVTEARASRQTPDFQDLLH